LYSIIAGQLDMTLRGYESSPVIQQFKAAMARRSLVQRRPLVADGRIHRCDVKGKHGRGDGSYLLHLDGAIPAGGFQNWQDGAGWEDWSNDMALSLATCAVRGCRSKTVVPMPAQR
jgi:putative DNA primase/helicase